jgi:biotin synthase
MDAEPTTVYLLTYKRGKCLANCRFCPQSRTSRGRTDMLSRVVWPVFETAEVIPRIASVFKEGRVKRVCIQALNYRKVLEDLVSLVRQIRSSSPIPISISCQPLNREGMLRLADIGIIRVSVALDAANEMLFEKVKGRYVGGPYTWKGHLKALNEAVKIFGINNVTTHLIVGLGESEEDLIRTIQKCVDLGVYPSLFAFTPIKGTEMADNPQPPLDLYRRVQVAHYLMTQGINRYEDMKFHGGRLVDFGVSDKILHTVIESGEPFKTSGCPGCNRPYYNEMPGGPIYNFPRQPTSEEISEIKRLLNI